MQIIKSIHIYIFFSLMRSIHFRLYRIPNLKIFWLSLWRKDRKKAELVSWKNIFSLQKTSNKQKVLFGCLTDLLINAHVFFCFFVYYKILAFLAKKNWHLHSLHLPSQNSRSTNSNFKIICNIYRNKWMINELMMLKDDEINYKIRHKIRIW